MPDLRDAATDRARVRSLGVAAFFAAGLLLWCAWPLRADSRSVPAVPLHVDLASDQGVTEVTVVDHAFVPEEVSIPVGSIVRWTNRGAGVHTVTSDDGLFHQSLAPGQTYSLRFLSRGVFGYRCLQHPEAMRGRVVVGDQATTTPPTPGPTAQPDADAIVFNYFADGTNGTRTDLFLVDPDGSDRRALLTTADVSEVQPSWSPGKDRVAFTATSGDPRLGPWRIHVLDLGDGRVARLTGGQEDYEPDWRPDGSHLVYTSLTRSGPTVVSSQLTAIRADGTGVPQPLVRVNSTIYSVGNPSWSPDGDRIAFVLESGPAGGELYAYEWRTGSARKLYDHPGWSDVDPAWSPDGRFVAFASGAVPQPFTPDAAVRHDIWVLDTTTGLAGAIVYVPGWDLRGPSWSADGTEIVFSAKYQTDPSAWGLYVAPAFGGAAARPLTTGVEPDWGGVPAALPTPVPPATPTLPLPPDPPTLEPPPTLIPPPVTPGPSPTPPAPPTFAWPTLEPTEPTPTVQPPTETVTPTATATASPTTPPPSPAEHAIHLPIAYAKAP